jgi:16S rRNA (guanine1516-N2)-methyltransferase
MSARGVPAPPVSRLYHHPAAHLEPCWMDWFQLREAPQPPDDESGYYLWAAEDHLELRRGCEAHGAWVRVAELERRTAQGTDLLKACGVGGERRPRVLDLMAGWGVDALVLAARGCPVTAVERLPMLAALLQDLVGRSGISGVAVQCADAMEVLDVAQPFDVVYLDPMFPQRHKAALPGKRLQWLAELAAPDPRSLEIWLTAAAPRAQRRVVLKRRRKDPLVATPDWQVAGRTVRYDVYRGSAAQDGG